MSGVLRSISACATYDEVSALLRYDPDTGLICWRLNRGPKKAGSEAGTYAYGYRQINVCGKIYRAHRLAWLLHTGHWPDSIIDHVNGDRSDNRWSNLRLASYSQNAMNCKIHNHNKSGAKGVFWDKQRQKWRASVIYLGKRKHAGFYETVEEASAAYEREARRLAGDFVRLA